MQNCNAVPAATLAASPTQLQQEAQLAGLAKALAHPARVRILVILNTIDRAGGCLNGDLVAELGLAQSTVSEHLRILKQASLIHAEPQPPKMCYRIHRERLHFVSNLLHTLCLS